MNAYEYMRELLRAEGYFELGMGEDALHVLHGLPSPLQARPEVLLLRVRVLLTLGQRAEAEALAENVVAGNPRSSDALFCLAMAQAQLGKKVSARNTLTAALLLDSSLRHVAEEVFKELYP